MKPLWRERLKAWWCSLVGHRLEQIDQFTTRTFCRRCGRIS